MIECAVCHSEYDPSEGNEYLCAPCVAEADKQRRWRDGMTYERAVRKMELRLPGPGLEPGTGEIVSPEGLIEILKDAVNGCVTNPGTKESDAMRDVLWAHGLIREYHTVKNTE